MERVIVLVDMDCFYAQVEQRDRPELWGKPVGVLQYSANGQSGLLAVSYEARPFGVKRGMTAVQAKQVCPEIEICLVPQGEFADKADVGKYRDASAEVFAVLASADSRVIVERASVDEAFLDVSGYVDSRMNGERRADLLAEIREADAMLTTHVVDATKEEEGQRDARLRSWIQLCEYDDQQLRLALAVLFTERLRAEICQKTQFFCSAGIANNKTMAKLVCAYHKPRQQSVVPVGCAATVIRESKLSSIRGLGGKLGALVAEKLRVETVGGLAALPEGVLEAAFPENASWLRSIAKGECEEAVKSRMTQTSIGVGKNFPGRLAITTDGEARHWLEGLTKELVKRIIDDQLKNKRTPENVIVHLTTDSTVSRTVKVRGGRVTDGGMMGVLWPVLLALKKADPGKPWNPPIVNISMSAGKFKEGMVKDAETIMGWVKRRAEPRKVGMRGTPTPVVETFNEGDSVEDENRAEETGEEEGGVGSEGEEDDVTVVAEVAAAFAPDQEFDEEGWEVWSDYAFSRASAASQSTSLSAPLSFPFSAAAPLTAAAASTSAAGPSSSAASSSSSAAVALPDVSREIFNELPDHIKAELRHIDNLKAAKELKKKREGGKKRKAKIATKETPAKKSIASFFSK